MSDDLHARLKAAIGARLEVAWAATPGPWMSATNTGRKDGVSLIGRVADRGTGRAIAVFAATDVRQRAADAQHAALSDPADAALRYERDLKVLERHTELPNSWGSCTRCRTSSTDRHNDVLPADWPCDEITDLLDVYPEVTR